MADFSDQSCGDILSAPLPGFPLHVSLSARFYAGGRNMSLAAAMTHLTPHCIEGRGLYSLILKFLIAKEGSEWLNLLGDPT